MSLHHPWGRQIARGKAKAPVEFGAKITMSQVNGYRSVEHLSWDAYHEGTTFQASVERYHAYTGVYPKRVLAGKSYRNRENLQFCKVCGFRIFGTRLGRPSKDKALNR